MLRKPSIYYLGFKEMFKKHLGKSIARQYYCDNKRSLLDFKKGQLTLSTVVYKLYCQILCKNRILAPVYLLPSLQFT